MRKTDSALRYLWAILATLAALLGIQNPYHTAWLAVAFSAWCCGIGPSIVTTLLVALGVDYWFLPPFHAFAIRDRTQAFGLLGFVIFSSAIIALGESNRRGPAARSRLAAIVESSDDAIVSKNLDGIITSWNRGAEQLLGYSAEEAVGRHIKPIVPRDRRDEEVMILQRLRRGERVDHFETIRVRKDGATLHVSLTISPVRDASGRVIGASKVARDISERTQQQEELRKSERRLREMADGLESQVRARTRELEQRNLEVSEQSAQLRVLSNRLVQTQDEERRRVALELHDSAGQIVTALGMQFARIAQQARENSEIAKITEDGQTLVQELSKEIRTMSYLLHPPLLDESGLSEAIRWYIQGLTERSSLIVDLRISDGFGRLPNDLELALFRIVQECLTNIHRHAHSTTATIHLSRSDGSVALEIEDNGKGISPEKLAQIRAQRSGVGFTGMQERLRHFNGEMRIESNGDGTKISCELPVQAAAPVDSENLRQHANNAG